MSPFGTKPVLSAVSREKRGSASTSSITSGWRLTRTKPAMPVLEGKRLPMRDSDASSAAASKTSSSVSVSSSNWAAWMAWSRDLPCAELIRWLMRATRCS